MAVDVSQQGRVRRPAKRQRLEKSDTQLLSSDTDENYMDLPEVESAPKGGAQMHPLLLQGSRCCYTKEKGELVAKTPAKELEKLNLILIRCVG